MMFALGGSEDRQDVLLTTKRLIVKATSVAVLYLHFWKPSRAQQLAHGSEYLPLDPTKPRSRSPGLRRCLTRSLKAL